MKRGFEHVPEKTEPPKLEDKEFAVIEMGNGLPYTTAEVDAMRLEECFYTDGACIKSASASGGWAFIAVSDIAKMKNQKRNSNWGGAINTTNNEMELTAILEAHKHAQEKMGIKNYAIYSDSQYALKCIQFWYKKWEKNGWETINKEPVKNAALIREIVRMRKTADVKYKWVKGHSGIIGNELADTYATQMADYFEYEL